MPLYRFNAYGWKGHLDEEGFECPDATTACQHAVWSLGQILKDGARDKSVDKHTTMVVYDEAAVSYRSRPVITSRFDGKRCLQSAGESRDLRLSRQRPPRRC